MTPMTDRIEAPRLRRLIERAGRAEGAGSEPAAATERCELCAAPVPPGHRHLLDLSTRGLMCVCRPCALLFDRPAAGGDHYRLIPDRRWYVADFDLDDAAWAGLNIPVDMAFFFHNSTAERVVAYYPSPAGPTESLLTLTTWQQIVADNPVLSGMEHDVEALLAHRAKDTRDHWLVPVDDCYDLVGLIRRRWQGLGGGDEVWEEIDDFFAGLRRRSRTVHRDGTRPRRGRDDQERKEEEAWQPRKARSR